MFAGSQFLTSCALLPAEWSSFLLGETAEMGVTSVGLGVEEPGSSPAASPYSLCDLGKLLDFSGSLRFSS